MSYLAVSPAILLLLAAVCLLVIILLLVDEWWVRPRPGARPGRGRRRSFRARRKVL